MALPALQSKITVIQAELIYFANHVKADASATTPQPTAPSDAHYSDTIYISSFATLWWCYLMRLQPVSILIDFPTVSLNFKKFFLSSVFAAAWKTSNRAALAPPLHSSSVVLVQLLGSFSAMVQFAGLQKGHSAFLGFAWNKQKNRKLGCFIGVH